MTGVIKVPGAETDYILFLHIAILCNGRCITYWGGGGGTNIKDPGNVLKQKFFGDGESNDIRGLGGKREHYRETK